MDQSLYNQEESGDDTLVMATQWCASHLLYLLWVISMLTTGLAASNTRSQPSVFAGKLDYCVELQDSYMGGGIGGPTGSAASIRDPRYYEKTIYQADENPQFWGQHIYRPAQATVEITSR